MDRRFQQNTHHGRMLGTQLLPKRDFSYRPSNIVRPPDVLTGGHRHSLEHECADSMKTQNFQRLQNSPSSGPPRHHKTELLFPSVDSQLPVGYYTHASDGKAAFSTRRGQLPFRHMQHMVPLRDIQLWNKEEIQAASNALRQADWEVVKALERPTEWADLYHWFDSHDLYYQGAQNLWNVIDHLCNENEVIRPIVAAQIHAEIEKWADYWVFHPPNKQDLISWNEAHGPIINLVSARDREDLGTINESHLPLIQDALKRRKISLMRNTVVADGSDKHKAALKRHDMLAKRPDQNPPSKSPTRRNLDWITRSAGQAHILLRHAILLRFRNRPLGGFRVTVGTAFIRLTYSLTTCKQEALSTLHQFAAP